MFQRSPEVEAVVRRYLTARDEGDMETISNLHSSSEHVRVIGSDQHEWYSGHDEVVAMQKIHLDEQPRRVSDLSRLEAYANGNTAWAALDMEISFENERSFRARQTIVLVIESGIWRIAQVHWSIPVTNEVVDGVELTRTLSDLLGSIDSFTGPGPDDPAETQTATFMFTDIVDSTDEAPSGGETSWSELVGAHFDMARKIVEANGGSVVKTLGSGGMYVFPTGTGALTSGAAIQRAAGESVGDSAVRIGIHTGDVVQGGGDYRGLTVAKAAGVAAAADGGQILVSRSTLGMVNSSEYDFGEPLNVELEGIPGTHALIPLILAGNS